jgi:nondiscriminating glutamyl-tRNA synthetase
MFRTRQAPSPTGYLHFGTACTMLFTQLIARSKGGIWYLRIEDTDRNRLQPEAVGSLLESMSKLGLIPDEGVNNMGLGEKDTFYNIYQTGELGPYIQSQRLDVYHKYANELLNKKLAYWSFLGTEDKEVLQELKKINKKPIDFYQANLQKLAGAELTESNIILENEPELETLIYQSVNSALKDPRKPDLRFKILAQKTIETNDYLLGKSTFNLSLEEDFTILKSDSYPTYHLAHAIDDKLMQTSLVIRTQEWLSSQPKHICLTQALWGTSFEYLHLPYILAEKGNKKMSKRDGNVNMQAYLEAGYLPEAIVNYLAFLGWNPGTDQELFLEAKDFETLDQKSRLELLFKNLSHAFNIDKLTKAPSRFNIEKLKWYNQQYLKMLGLQEFNVLGQLEPRLINLLDQERTTLLSDPKLNSEMLINYSKPNLESLSFKGCDVEQTKEALAVIKPLVIKVLKENEEQKELLFKTFESDPNAPLLESYSKLYKKIENDLKTLLKEKELSFGPYLFPLRIALSAQQQSPSPFELLAILDNDTILVRLEF